MCGIFGIITDQEETLGPTLIASGKRLAYRGYDSVGCATVEADGTIDLRKGVGREKYPLDRHLLGINRIEIDRHGEVDREDGEVEEGRLRPGHGEGLGRRLGVAGCLDDDVESPEMGGLEGRADRVFCGGIDDDIRPEL